MIFPFFRFFCAIFIFHFLYVFHAPLRAKAPPEDTQPRTLPARYPARDPCPGHPLSRTAPKFCSFFSSSRLKLHSLCSLSGRLFVEFRWCFGLPGSSCEAPAAPPGRRELRTCILAHRNILSLSWGLPTVRAPTPGRPPPPSGDPLPERPPPSPPLWETSPPPSRGDFFGETPGETSW